MRGKAKNVISGPAMIFVLALSMAGCSKGVPSGTTGPAGPTVFPVTIELSEPEATFAEEQMGNIIGPVLRWKVKYRVTQGQLDPKTWYMCSADISGGGGSSIIQIQGKDLGPSGVFQQGAVVGQMKPESLKIHVARGLGKGHYNETISNVVNCSVR